VEQFSRHLLGDEALICPNFSACRRSRKPGDAFREGIMSHVGKRFDLKTGRRHLRIVVVGQESGWSKGPGAESRRRLVSVAERYHAIHDVTCLERRCYAEPAP